MTLSLWENGKGFPNPHKRELLLKALGIELHVAEEAIRMDRELQKTKSAVMPHHMERFMELVGIGIEPSPELLKLLIDHEEVFFPHLRAKELQNKRAEIVRAGYKDLLKARLIIKPVTLKEVAALFTWLTPGKREIE